MTGETLSLGIVQCALGGGREENVDLVLTLVREAARLGIAGRVRFLGFLGREDLRAELQAAACVVNPADYESGPLTLLEAMAAGAPVVSTPTGLAREFGPRAPLLIARPEAGSKTCSRAGSNDSVSGSPTAMEPVFINRATSLSPRRSSSVRATGFASRLASAASK